MSCERWREGLSARLDGEAPGVPAAALEAHLADCPACRAWAVAAERATRLARVGAAAPVPDVTERVLAGAALDRPRWGRRSRMVRAVLAAVALAMGALALRELSGQGQHTGHEAAALTFALAAGYLAVAIRPERVAGALPFAAAAAAFVVGVTLRDAAQGRAYLFQERAHALLVAGLVLLLLLRAEAPTARRRARRGVGAARGLSGRGRAA